MYNLQINFVLLPDIRSNEFLAIPIQKWHCMNNELTLIFQASLHAPRIAANLQ
jgi:hypothetical protein